MKGKEILRAFWQLPQNIIGTFLVCSKGFSEWFTCNDGEKVTVYYRSSMMGSGISLGDYIILDPIYKEFKEKFPSSKLIPNTVNHEHGHQKQSRILGPLYLIVIGLPSILGNIFSRLFHSKWSQEKSDKWYYNQPWEKWADKLGGVVRQED